MPKNLIIYRAYVGDKSMPNVRKVYGYTLAEAEEGEVMNSREGNKGKYAILECGEDPSWDSAMVLYVSDNLSDIRPVFDDLCKENDTELNKTATDTKVMIQSLWKSKMIYDIDNSQKIES